MLPKSNKPDNTFYVKKYGKERVDELLENSDLKTTFLPETILTEDLHYAFLNLIKEGNLKFSLDKIPKVEVFFVVGERWSDQYKTWFKKGTDGNVEMPFIAVKPVERPVKGQRLGDIYNIPFRNRFRYVEIPVFDGNYLYEEIYKVTQPVNLTLNYLVRFFSPYKQHHDRISEHYQKMFSFLQNYGLHKGNYFPCYLENVSGDDNLDSFEQQRFYTTDFTIRMEGFIQDSNDFQRIKGIKKNLIKFSI